MGNNQQNVDEFNRLPGRKFFIFPQKPVYGVIMFSLDAAGKTTLLYNLVTGQVPASIPSIGFNVEKVEFEKNTLQLWEIGGGFMIRQLWKHYVGMMKAIIYVIDLSDEERLEQALQVLRNLLAQQGCKGKCLFIVGNKKDVAQPRMMAQLEKRVTEMNMPLRYQLKYVSAVNNQEVVSMFKEISEVMAIV